MGDSEHVFWLTPARGGRSFWGNSCLQLSLPIALMGEDHEKEAGTCIVDPVGRPSGVESRAHSFFARERDDDERVRQPCLDLPLLQRFQSLHGRFIGCAAPRPLRSRGTPRCSGRARRAGTGAGGWRGADRARRISVGCGPLQGLLGQAEEMAREILERGVYGGMLRGALSATTVNELFPQSAHAERGQDA
jgi:hypothetical protein